MNKFYTIATIALFLCMFCDKMLCSQGVYVGEFRSANNPYYWKNNKLLPSSYWQQDVEYEIKALVNDIMNLIDASHFKLTYYNNSPHTLNELYFHLYENAFQPGSYYHNLWKANRQKPIFGANEVQGLGTKIDDLKIDSVDAKVEFDNTIMKVILNKPLLPGDKIVVTCKFKTWWDNGNMRRRNKYFNTGNHKHFDGVHWYPVMCVYDAKAGWHTDQHLDKEFYANFGSFKVELTFPEQYIVEATGVLQNRNEVLPDTLYEKIMFKNYFENSFYKYSVPATGKYKTWKYFATNVHNFAFTADPLYRVDEVDWNGVKVIALAQEPHVKGWKQSANFTKNVMEVYSHDFGNYIWPKIIVADAQDGMEYPMLTLDGGTYPAHQSLLAHEVGHMWFYGMVANNETYRALLDEGFTQFLTIWSMDKIVGAKRPRAVQGSKFFRKKTDSIINRFEALYNPYITDVWSGYDMPLNTHSSDFNGAIRQGGGYRAVYYKSGTMLYNLKYVLGDSVFAGAMKYYVKKYTGAHPYPEDFRQTIMEYTQTDLNWFFDQWMETTKYIDYGIKGLKHLKVNHDGIHTYSIRFKRLGTMQMPIDFVVTTFGNQQKHFHIPNTWYVKPTSAAVLPRWIGWGMLNSHYKAVVTVDGFIKNVRIDTSLTMADIDLRNNSIKSIDEFKFDFRIPNPPKWYKSTNYLRPDLWYNSYDGLMVGFAGYGDYFNQQSFYEFYASFNSRILQSGDIPEMSRNENRRFSIGFTERNNLIKTWRQLYYFDEFHYNSGLIKGVLGLEKIFRNQDLRNQRSSKVGLNYTIMCRELPTDGLYLLYPGYWEIGKLNSSFNLAFQRSYPLSVGYGDLNIELRTPGFASSFNYYYIQLTHISFFSWRFVEMKNRIYARYGGGEHPRESALYIASMSPEQLFGNRLTRAAGLVPDAWLGYGVQTNHFHMGGGLNLRGYAGYLAPETHDGVQYFTNMGLSGASFSTEIDFDKLIPVKPYRFFRNFHIDTYIFHDMGTISFHNIEDKQILGKLRMSSGVGSALTIKFGRHQIKPLVVRFDMPLFVNFAPSGEHNFAVRYVVGLGRCF